VNDNEAGEHLLWEVKPDTLLEAKVYRKPLHGTKSDHSSDLGLTLTVK